MEEEKEENFMDLDEKEKDERELGRWGTKRIIVMIMRRRMR